MPSVRLKESDASSIDTPGTGRVSIFLDSATGDVSVKDDTGTVFPLGGSGLTVGGDLVGSLPNPSLAPTAVVAGAYGDASHIVTLTVDARGRLTAASTLAVSIAESNLTLTDITTNNVSTSEHGFAPKLPNDATKFLNGTGGYTVPSGAGDALVANPLSQFAATTSAQLAGVLSDETGTGAAVFGTGPTLTNPVVGTQTAGDNSTKGASTAYADNAVAKQLEALMFAVSDEATAITTGTAKLTCRMPFACSMTALPRANLNTVSSSGLPEVNIKKNGTTSFSTNLTIDASEKTSVTAATPAALSSSPTTFSDDDEVTFDIVTAGTGAKGLKVTMNVVRT